MSTAKARLMRRVRRYLAVWKVNIGLDNDLGLTDINSDAEDFCCGLLNIILDAKFQNLNLLQMNFPAIDLADSSCRICVQVTSTAEAEKITHTLDRFFDRGLEKDYDRLIVLILGNKRNYRTKFPEKDGFHFDSTQDIWDITKLLTKIAGLGMTKLNQVEAYLREQLGDLGDMESPLDLPVLSALEEDSFLGRDDELDAITHRFEDNKIVILSGLGGMGKTELAVRFAQTRWSGESYFVCYTKNWRQTVLENIAPRIQELNRDTLDVDRIYRNAMAKLKHRGADELLILDNVDQEEGSITQLKRELSELNMRVLITTRTDVEQAIPVEMLRREELLRLFEIHESAATSQERIALIEAVDGHTLTVDLMARALRPGRRAATAEKLLNNLADSSVRKVDTAYPGGPTQARIIEHLKVVFQVLKLDDNEKELLRYATLLPDGGMMDSLFLSPIREDREDALDNLIRNGWLRWQEGLLLIHPVIRKVCMEELAPSDANCVAFLSDLCGQYDATDYQSDLYRQMAEFLTNASLRLVDTAAWWSAWAAPLWHKVGDFAKALECNLRAVKDLENIFSQSPTDLATLYGQVGGTFGDLGDHRNALDYKQKALAIRQKTFSDNHPDVAASYNSIGTTYSDLGDHTRALEYQQKALTILEEVLQPGDLGLVAPYHSIACTYGQLGNWRKALDYALKALAIQDKVLPTEHPDRAQAYNNVASAYNGCGNGKAALEYMLKALAIQEKTLPRNHPYLAVSYSNVAMIYHGMGNFQEATFYMDRAADSINCSSLPKEHPHRVHIAKLAPQFAKDAKMQKEIMAQVQKWGMPPFGSPRQ